MTTICTRLGHLFRSSNSARAYLRYGSLLTSCASGAIVERHCYALREATPYDKPRLSKGVQAGYPDGVADSPDLVAPVLQIQIRNRCLSNLYVPDMKRLLEVCDSVSGTRGVGCMIFILLAHLSLSSFCWQRIVKAFIVSTLIHDCVMSGGLICTSHLFVS